MKISINLIFNFFVVSFLSWVFINNLLFDVLVSVLVLLFVTILFLNFYVYKRKFFVYFLFIIIWFLFWVFISNNQLQNVKENNILLSRYYWNKVNISWKIDEVYKVKEDGIEYKIKIYSIGKKDFVDNEIYSIVSIPFNFKLNLWDIINFDSKVYDVKNFDGFKYREFLLTQDVYFKAYVSVLSIVDHEELNIIISKLYKFREKTLSVINKIYPEEEAIFLWWILLGAREELSEDLKSNFNNSWLTHLIAVSGFNITVLIIFFSYILKFVPVYVRTVFIVFWVIIFTILVWGWASVVRAAIMWIIGYLVLISGRQWNPLSIILLTALIMILFSPLSLNYDVSFHLSFLAVFWIVYTQKFFNKIFFFLPEFMAIKEAFVLTMASLTFTLPIMMFNFWQVSLLAPISNILLTWTIPIAMFLWFLSILVYFFFQVWGVFLWFFAWIFLKYDITIVHLFWSFDSFVIKMDFGNYSNYLEFLYFLLLVFCVIYFGSEKRKVDEKSLALS